MAKYDISWAGLDRGHEGLWRPDVWIAPLKALAKYSSVDYSDAKHAIYKELTRECPNVEWLSFERQSKTARSLFRDNREPWYSTGVITFVGTSMSVSPLGKQILAGELTYSQVLARAMAGWEEHGENPFAILSDVFLRIGAYRGLSFDDVVRIMQNFREGDDVCLALEAQVYPLSGVAPRRLKAILLLMVYSGAITCVGNVYFSSDRQGLIRISGSDKFDVDEFGLKIGDQSDDGAVTIIGADKLCYQVRNISRGAEGVRTISKKLLGEWVIAVKDDPTATAESLRGKLTGKTEVDKFEYGYFSTLYKMAQMVLNKDSIKKLSAEELSRLIKDAKPLEPSNADRLTIALKLFEKRRYGEEWQANVIKDSYLHIFKVCETAADDLRKMSLEEFKEKFLDRVWAFQNGGSRKYGQLSEEERVGYRDFVASLIPPIKSFGDYFPPSEKCPRGMGVGMISELLMRFHPDACCSYNDQLIHDALVTLGLAEGEFEWPKTPSIYQDFMGKCAKILRKMEEMKFARTPVEGDKDKPNYITVNEFLWFVHDHKDLIKEKIMKLNQIKAEPEKLKTDGAKTLSDLIAGGPDSLMTMLTAALLAKPFAILAGASGTGKSRMVKKLAYMTCNADQLRNEKDETPGNYCMVAVKPNWHDSSELLGYRSAISESHEYVTPDFIKFILRAHAFPKTPFFVCLDEMNLAPVEQYFAEFLSACESIRKNKEGEWVSDPLIQPGEFDKNVANLAPDYSLPDACIKRINERGLYIPHNLFVVGTVNMDDTTHQFSRKVLDRAMTLMMDDVDFGTLQDAQYEKLTNELLMNGDDIMKFIDRGEFDGKDLEENFKVLLGKLQTALKESPFAIGYRFAIESVLYRKALALLGIDEAALDATAADHMALMKILPRITGTLEERDAVLKNLAEFFGALGDHKQSGERLEKMKTAAGHNGDYISFWP